MPLVRIDMIRGKSPEYKKAVFEAVHTGLIEALEIEDWDRFQRIVEIDKEDFEVPGRTREQKKRAIELITEKLTDKPGIAATDIFIVINEPPLENWGMAGKQKE